MDDPRYNKGLNTGKNWGIFGNHCLQRNIRYDSNDDVGPCKFVEATEIKDDIEENSNYTLFREDIKDYYDSQVYPCFGGNMDQKWRPDDPVFFLVITFIDYLWSIWQECHVDSNYPGDDISELLDYSPYAISKYTVEDVLDLDNYCVTYERGPIYRQVGDFECSTSRRLQPALGGSNASIRETIQYFPKYRADINDADVVNITVEICEDNRRGCPLDNGWLNPCASMERIDPNQINGDFNILDLAAITRGDINITLEELISFDELNDCQNLQVS